MTNASSNTWALLIGVDCYLPNRLPDGSYYPSLGGCVRDTTHVEAFLRRTWGIPDERILKLTATNTGALQPPEPQEQWPTYENMVAAIKRLTDLAQPGDYVYFHYSGHGGRAPTIYPQRKGANGLDESLVPTDIGNSTARYLRDLEMVKLLDNMVAKGLVVTVVFDSCHSGGMVRGRGDVAIRGISSVDTSERPTESLAGAPEELFRAWDQATDRGTRNVSLGSGWLPEPRGYTMLAACRPSESAHEYAFDGKERNGALTYWLLNALENAGTGVSHKDLHDRIVGRVHSQFENQTPQLQGEGDRIFLGSERVQPYYAAPVIEVDLAGKRLLLGAGQAQGLRTDAQFAVYPPGADLADPAQRQAVVSLIQVGATTSWAAFVEPLPEQPVEPGAQAVLLGAGNVRLVQKVALVRQAELPAGIDQEAALQAVEHALPGNGWVELAEPDGQVDYNVALNDQGEYEIWDRAGYPITNVRPPVKPTDTDAVVAIVRRLIHLAKYNAVKQLSNPDPRSPLARTLEVELVGKRAQFDPADPFEPEQRFNEPGQTPVLTVDEWTGLRIKNTAQQRLNITVLDLQPDWGVSQVYPLGAGDYFIAFEPGEEQILPLQAGLPEGYNEGRDVLKVFATGETSNFRWLELPALDEPLLRSADVRNRKPQSQLEQLLASFTADQPPTRNLTPAAYPTYGWITAQVEVAVKKAG